MFETGSFRQAALGLGVLLLVAGCATTRPSGEITERGFLDDYSMLEEGTKNTAQLIHISPDVDFTKYDAVMVDSVTFWTKEGSNQLEEKTRQALASYFLAAIKREVGKVTKVATLPGEGVVRVSLAITEAEGASVVTDSITTIIPQLRLLSTLTGKVTDSTLTVGEAGFEGKATDSRTGKLLMAGVDRRVGTKVLRGVFKKWDDVERAMDFWAERFAQNLTKLLQGQSIR